MVGPRLGSPEGSEPSGVPAGAPRPSRAPRAGMRGAEGAGTAAPRVPVGFCSPGSPRWRCRGCPRGLPALTVAVEQLQAVVDPVVGLFAVGFLNSKKTREMGKGGKRNDKYIAGSFSSAWVPGGPGAGRGSSRQLPLPRAYGGIRETPPPAAHWAEGRSRRPGGGGGSRDEPVPRPRGNRAGRARERWPGPRGAPGYSPSPSPRSPRRRCARSPRAAPAGRTEPGRSGKSWISSGWKEAASRSEPGPDPLRWDHKEPG